MIPALLHHQGRPALPVLSVRKHDIAMPHGKECLKRGKEERPAQ